MGAVNSLQPIIEAVTSRIANGDYGAGQRLPTEAALQRQWAVSRSVVREAMRVLAAQGLVSIEQGRGTFVRPANHAPLQAHLDFTLRRAGAAASAMKADIDAPLRSALPGQHEGGRAERRDDLDHLLEVRQVLEVAVAERAACSASDADMQAMAQAIAAMRADARDAAACAEADLAFHRALARSAGNPLWPAILDSLNDLLRRLQHYGHHGRANALQAANEHAAVLAAIGARDGAAAAQCMEQHLASAATDLQRARQRSPMRNNISSKGETDER